MDCYFVIFARSNCVKNHPRNSLTFIQKFQFVWLTCMNTKFNANVYLYKKKGTMCCVSRLRHFLATHFNSIYTHFISRYFFFWLTRLTRKNRNILLFHFYLSVFILTPHEFHSILLHIFHHVFITNCVIHNKIPRKFS